MSYLDHPELAYNGSQRGYYQRSTRAQAWLSITYLRDEMLGIQWYEEVRDARQRELSLQQAERMILIASYQ